MTQAPPEPLVPNNTLITRTPEEGRALAMRSRATPFMRCRKMWRR